MNNIILNNKYFILSLSLVVLQQALLAISTYFIALAGENIFSSQHRTIIFYISLFFIFALSSYLISSINSLVIVKLKNSLWEVYINNTFNEFKLNQELNSAVNKEKLINWLSGEANSTLERLSYFITDTVSLYLNVIFTFIIFYLTLGFEISTIIGTSLIISIVVVSILNKKIGILARNNQQQKLSVNTYFSAHWDYLFNSNKGSHNLSYNKINKKIDVFFKTDMNYSILEQVIAIIPIAIAVPALIVYLSTSYAHTSASDLGVMIAVLPRTLQLLGNVHGLSISNSRILFMRSKYKQLLEFQLDPFSLEVNISRDDLKIYHKNNDTILSVNELENLIRQENTYGRVIIEGKNGSGKSTLLKKLKGIEDNSILISPDTNFDSAVFIGSTGQKQIDKMKFFLQSDAKVILLDEWNANLDESNFLLLDKYIDEKSQNTLIIEVRHRHSSYNPVISPSYSKEVLFPVSNQVNNHKQ